jgi:hypothetical protein
MTAVASMKWLFNVVVTTRRRFYARDRKENGTILRSAGRPAKTNLQPRILIMTSPAQMLRNVDEISSPKIPCEREGSQNPGTIPPIQRGTIFFSTVRTSTCWNSATIRPNSLVLADHSANTGAVA